MCHDVAQFRTFYYACLSLALTIAMRYNAVHSVSHSSRKCGMQEIFYPHKIIYFDYNLTIIFFIL